MLKIFLIVSSSLLIHLVYSQQLQPPALPLVLDQDQLPLLRNQVNEQLQTELTTVLYKNAKWKKLIKQKKMAVGLVDISDTKNIKFARVNGNVMMYAASLPKIAILLAAMDAIEKGEINQTEEIYFHLDQMIGKSSNVSATFMIDQLGYEKIENVLRDKRYQLYDEEYGGGLWVGKKYASAGKKNPDPIKGLSHAASVSQVCRFYYLLAMGKLVSEERSKQMLNLMDNPKLHHKFVNTLNRIAPGAKLYRKSGSWKIYHSDSVLVWGPEWRRYILVALVEDSQGEKIMRNLIKPIEEALKRSSQS